MTDHITTTTDGVAALDYEMAKDVFHEKLTNDLHGRGRMESAFYHTAQWIFLQGCAERDALLARIAELEDEVDNLPCDAHCAALSERGMMRAEIEAELKRWISIADRLPDDNKTVLVATDDGDVWVAHHDGEDWFDSASATSISSCGVSVTHWMYFPTGPSDA